VKLIFTFTVVPKCLKFVISSMVYQLSLYVDYTRILIFPAFWWRHEYIGLTFFSLILLLGQCLFNRLLEALCFALWYLLAETPGVARDYIRNEGTPKINLVLYKNNYHLLRFKPPEKEPRYSMNRRRGGPQNWSGCQATAPEQTPKKRLDIIYMSLPSNGPRTDPK
jgi:hypothetical protein